MSSFNANSQAYNIATENELAVVLSHYNSNFVFSIVDEAMKARFLGVPLSAVPNVVGAWEQNFKAIKAQYGMDSHEEVLRVRNETYREIIDTICKEFRLNFTIDDTVDLYSAAFHMYDLFVCKFTECMVAFFANFIYRERSALYDNLGLTNFKKNKDSSTSYGKKVYKDIKLAVINANIDMVVSAVCSMNIDFQNVLSTIYGTNSELRRYISTIISTGPDFFARAYNPVLASDIRPDVITAIRFKLQEIAIAHDQTLTSSELMPEGSQNNQPE